MAKWGEGDPRWIVEERPDATNVNNWHWTERNAGPWSTERLRELFQKLVIARDGFLVNITDVEKLDGEASANNRKGKLIFFYEWNIVLKWEGSLTEESNESKVEGKVTIPNLSEENDVSEIDIAVSVTGNSAAGDILKTFMEKFGRDVIRDQIALYISSLREEFSKGMILPKKDGSDIKPDGVSSITSGFNKKISMEPVVASTKSIGNVDIDTLTLNHKFQCKAEEFYDALTKIEMVTAFTRGHVKLDATVGGNFVLFGGNITGTFKELIPGKKIVQTWRYKPWPENHYSVVTINIEEKSDHTDVTIIQTGVPKSDIDSTRENWDRYYWESMKRTFGFGAFFT